MIYSRSQSSPVLLSFLVSLLAATTQSIPINASGTLNKLAAPITTSIHPSGLTDCHPLIKRAVGGIAISGVPAGVNGRLDVVRRAVGTVADSGCGSAAATHTVSALAKRSVSDGAGNIAPIDLPEIPAAPLVDVAEVVDEVPVVGHLLPVLVKRSKKIVTPPAPKKSVPQAPPKAQSRITGYPAPSRAAGSPDTEQKWAHARAWK
ncbi:hypothetical protein PGTUg99_014115 [Puccinia graminis f. sp. tritici]|uniref:Uncharacterized protein n=1 Tax=Puccinia graminis f. sp. tritici TaxID=56615 RepID=A0A5B0MSI1_PUCGR|nr:hypothetical protein PGTUg99_014115 [Puccinia graminis f. sp. tritici]